MITLFIDTADKYLNIYLYDGLNKVSFFKEKNDLNLSIKLVPKIKEVIDNSSFSKNDIDQIMVVTGPGSFTGIRMGVTVAKTFAYSLKKKIMPISKLEVMAATKFEEEYILTMIDARRGFVYAALYDKNFNEIIKPSYLELEELIKITSEYHNKMVVATYDEFNLNIKTITPDENIDLIVDFHMNDQGLLAHDINPNYLKKTEAEEKNGNN